MCHSKSGADAQSAVLNRNPNLNGAIAPEVS